MKTVRTAVLVSFVTGLTSLQSLHSQEASSGFDLRATLTAETIASKQLSDAPRSGSPIILGGKGVVYPTWKINDNWFVTAALQLTTRPYYYEQLTTEGYGVKGIVLQSTLNYSHISHNGSILVRVGEMSTAFGSFMLRYDDTDNALIDIPIQYGYYYAPVSVLGVAGAQIDATKGKWDARAQFANSSPANPRSIFASDQYGNWTGGGGYTIRQGFRVGASGYRGPYLDRNYPYFFPGEANPSTLPASGVGIDVNWAHAHSSVLGELQRFVMPYKAIPTFHETAGYGEFRQVLSPRWYAAVRGGFSTANAGGNTQVLETAAGFRPGRFQLIKAGYQYEHYSLGNQRNNNTFAVQFITTIHKSIGRD